MNEIPFVFMTDLINDDTDNNTESIITVKENDNNILLFTQHSSTVSDVQTTENRMNFTPILAETSNSCHPTSMNIY